VTATRERRRNPAAATALAAVAAALAEPRERSMIRHAFLLLFALAAASCGVEFPPHGGAPEQALAAATLARDTAAVTRLLAAGAMNRMVPVLDRSPVAVVHRARSVAAEAAGRRSRSSRPCSPGRASRPGLGHEAAPT
jgi:hypothetical protein